MSLRKYIGLATVLAMAVSVSARKPGRPGIDRPIYVAQLMGVGLASNYWHTSIHTAGAVIQAMLANPTTEAYTGCPPACPLGPTITLPVPAKGFVYQAFGDTGTNNTQTGAPTAAEITAFMNALKADTFDVVIVHAAVQIMSAFTSAQQLAFNAWWDTSGLITSHASTDDNKLDIYDPWDTTQGAVFLNHPNADFNATVYNDTLDKNSPRIGYLDSTIGVVGTKFAGPDSNTYYDNSPDTNFAEEWFSFVQTSAQIRARTYLHVVLDIDEGSYQDGLDGATSMAPNHPMAWYRMMPAGGRVYYTAIGHLSQNMTTVANRVWRREIYNAILFASKYDSVCAADPQCPGYTGYYLGQAVTPDTAGTSILNAKAPGSLSDYAKFSISGSSLTISMNQSGINTVELLTLDGKRVDYDKGSAASHTFTNLRPNTLYVVEVSTVAGHTSQLVMAQ